MISRTIMLSAILLNLSSIQACQTSTVEQKIEDYPNFSIQHVKPHTLLIGGPHTIVSVDGGKTWETISYSRPEDIQRADDGPQAFKFAMHFISLENGWRTDPMRLNRLQRSTDGGRVWKEAALIEGARLSGVYFVSDERGWAFGERLYFTVDAGQSWNEVLSLRDFRDFIPFFLSSKDGWIASSNGKIARTTDGGNSWEIVNDLPRNIRDLFFVNSTVGWAVGDQGLIASTGDGGKTWLTQLRQVAEDTREVSDFFGLFFLNERQGWVCGEEGTVLVTTDGGKKWTQAVSDTRAPLSDIQFVDSSHGWAVGGYDRPPRPGARPSNVVIESNDGGLTWSGKSFMINSR